MVCRYNISVGNFIGLRRGFEILSLALALASPISRSAADDESSTERKYQKAKLLYIREFALPKPMLRPTESRLFVERPKPSQGSSTSPPAPQPPPPEKANDE